MYGTQQFPMTYLFLKVMCYRITYKDNWHFDNSDWHLWWLCKSELWRAPNYSELREHVVYFDNVFANAAPPAEAEFKNHMYTLEFLGQKKVAISWEIRLNNMRYQLQQLLFRV